MSTEQYRRRCDNVATSSECGATTSYTHFTYTFLNENNICINGAYQTNGNEFATAEICLDFPSVNNDEEDNNNDNNNNNDNDNGSTSTTACTVCIDYYCDIKKVKRYDTNLRKYCRHAIISYSYGTNYDDACTAYSHDTFFNDTMPSIIWPSYRRWGERGRHYELEIRNSTCEVISLPDNEIDITTAKVVLTAVFVSIVFITGYLLGKKYRPLSTSTNTNLIHTQTTIVSDTPLI